MAFKVEFEEQALRDLQDVFVYVADRADAGVAEAYDRRIRQACLRLVDFPGRGSPHDEIQAGLRSIAFERRATIFYRTIGSTVKIVQILHGGRDRDRAFSSK